MAFATQIRQVRLVLADSRGEGGLWVILHATSADVAVDDAMRFLREMRQLRSRAGLGLTELAARVHYPHDVMLAAEVGPSLPDLPVLSAYVRGCGGRVPEWEERWRSLTGVPAAPHGLPARPVGGSYLAAAGARAASSSSEVRIPDQRLIMAAISRASAARAAVPPIPAQARAALPATAAPAPAPVAPAPATRAALPATRAEAMRATRAERLRVPDTQAEARLPAVSRAPMAPAVPTARAMAVTRPRQVALASAAPAASTPAATSVSLEANAASAGNQPGRTVVVLWAPASVAGRKPRIIRLTIATVIVAAMIAIGAVIMLLLRKG